MSYSIYGAIVTPGGHGRTTEEEILSSAQKLGLIVEVGSRITNLTMIAEVVEEQEESMRERLLFYVLDEPGSDVSHKLISPNVEGDWTLARMRIHRNLQKIGKWLEEVLALRGVQKVTLYISEDYDDEFIEVRTTAEEFANAVLRIIGAMTKSCGR